MKKWIKIARISNLITKLFNITRLIEKKKKTASDTFYECQNILRNTKTFMENSKIAVRILNKFYGEEKIYYIGLKKLK